MPDLTAIASCVLTVGVAVVLLRHRVASQRMATLEAQANVLAAVGGAPGALTPGSHVYAVGTGRPRRLGRARPAPRSSPRSHQESPRRGQST